MNEHSGNSGQSQPPGALDYALARLDREAPQRVWLQIDTAGDNSERDVPWPGSEHVTWQDESIGGLEVEYVRADLAAQPDAVSGGDALDVPFAWTWISQAGERHVTTYERHARHIARADGCVVHTITPQMLAGRQPVGAEVPNGKPSWQSHNWAQIFQSEQGYWFGTVAGWDLSAHISDGFKGRSVNLLRSDGQFLAYDSYNPDWENSLEIRPTAPAAVPVDGLRESQILAKDHDGMRVSYSGLLRQARGALTRGSADPALAEMLRQLEKHMEELGKRWYAGDRLVVDELLQLYCIETNARRALLATHPQPAASCVNINAMRYLYLRAQPVEGGPWGTPRIAIPSCERAGEFANGDDADAAIDAAIAAQQTKPEVQP